LNRNAIETPFFLFSTQEQRHCSKGGNMKPLKLMSCLSTKERIMLEKPLTLIVRIWERPEGRRFEVRPTQGEGKTLKAFEDMSLYIETLLRARGAANNKIDNNNK
jgi:hypothetical protein